MTAIERLAERVAAGDALDFEDAQAVAGSHDLIAIGMMADDVRGQLHGRATTFVRVFEVHVGAVPRDVPQHTTAGEFRIVGQPDSAEAAIAAVVAVRRLAGEQPVTGFSGADLSRLADAASDTFERLRAAGLEAIAEWPVGGASSSLDHLTAARQAGLAVERLTVHDAPQEPLEAIRAAIGLLRAVGGFRAFAPLPRVVHAATPTTGYDDVKAVALARLLVRDIPSIQVDWPLYGPKLAQVALTVGADDVDGVAAMEPGTLGSRRTALEEIRGNIRAAGLEPFERDGRYRRIGES